MDDAIFDPEMLVGEPEPEAIGRARAEAMRKRLAGLDSSARELVGGMMGAPGTPFGAATRAGLAGVRSMLPGGGRYQQERDAIDTDEGLSQIPEVRRSQVLAANEQDMIGMGAGMAAPIVWHMTKPGAAAAIIRERRMIPREDGVFFSDRPFGEASSGYGTAAVRMDVPEERLRLDDEFPSGEKHYRVEATRGQPLDVGGWLDRGATRSGDHSMDGPNLKRNWSAVPASPDPWLGKSVQLGTGQRGVIVSRYPATGTSLNHMLAVKLEDGTIKTMPQTWKGWKW